MQSVNSLVLQLNQLGRLLMKRRKSIGPSTIPWGTPLIIYRASLRFLPVHHNPLLSVPQEVCDTGMCLSPVPVKWCTLQRFSRWSRIRSKALEKSKIARSVFFPFSKVLESLWTNVDSWVSQLRLARNPCWQSVRMLCSSRCSSMLLIMMICSCGVQQRLVRETGW